MIGQTVSHYRIEEKLGEGGMGVVYRAEDLKHHRKVAIKVFEAGHGASVNTERFLREIDAVAKLNHPHIVPVFDSGKGKGFLYFVMPFLTGESLRARLKREGRLPVEEAVGIAREVADALSLAHGRGILHRDVKPENILLEAGHAVLADFGIARAVSGAEGGRLTQTGVSLGTPLYSSPEQASGDPDLDERTDLYSLGCVLFEMVTGEPPFSGSSLQEVMARKVTETPSGLRQARSEVPEELEAVVLKAVARVPADRYATADDFGQALTVGLPPPEWVRARRGRRIRAVSLGTALVTFLATVGWWAYAVLLGGPEVVRLVVMPPEEAGDTTLRPFYEGVHRDLIDNVNKVPGLETVSRASAVFYQEAGMPLPQIAREAAADVIVKPTARQSPDSVVVAVELWGVTPERRLWQDSARAARRDEAAVFGRLAVAIARAMDVPVSLDDEARIGQARQVVPAALEAFRTGMSEMEQLTAASLERAIVAFNRAIELDSTFGKPYAMLSIAYVKQGGLWGFKASGLVQQEARTSAHRALAIDGSLAEAHLALAQVQCYFDWDFAAAEQSYLRAIQLNEELSLAHQYYRVFLSGLGRMEEALEQSRRAMELAPGDRENVAWHAWTLAISGHPDSAQAVLEGFEERWPDWPFTPFYLAMVYDDLGKSQEALEIYMKLWDEMDEVERARAPYGLLYAAGEALGRGGHRGRASAILDELVERRAAGEHVPSYAIAQVYVGLGQHEQALECLERGYEEHDVGMVALKAWHAYDPLRDDPRFQVLVRRVFGEYAGGWR